MLKNFFKKNILIIYQGLHKFSMKLKNKKVKRIQEYNLNPTPNKIFFSYFNKKKSASVPRNIIAKYMPP